MDKDKLIKTLQKADKLQKGKEVALANEFISLDEKIEKNAKDIDNKISEVIDEFKKKVSELDEELVYEVDEEKIVDSVLEKIPTPKDGKDYVLTEKDKKEIAKSIKVPVVKQIVEKTEVIRETPIITNEIKEVAVADTGEVIVQKINNLPIEEDKQIDASHIKNFKEQVRYYGSSGIKEIIAGAGISVDNSNLGYPVVSAPGSTTDEKVKYNVDDPTAGYISDKFIAGTGITLEEGTGADENKLKITNTINLSEYAKLAIAENPTPVQEGMFSVNPVTNEFRIYYSGMWQTLHTLSIGTQYYLLLESGDFLLQENGDKIIL